MPNEVVGLDACATKIVDEARVGAARERLLPEEELAGLTQLFRLLGDVTRARLLYALLEAGELCVCDLARVIGLSISATSHQLKALRAMRLVRYRMDGKLAYYSLSDRFVPALLDDGVRHLTAEGSVK